MLAILGQDLNGQLFVLWYLRSDQDSKQVVVDQPIFVMPVKPFSGYALSKGKVMAYIFDADLETFLKAAEFHVYDSMLLVQIKTDWLDELEY